MNHLTQADIEAQIIHYRQALANRRITVRQYHAFMEALTRLANIQPLNRILDHRY
jgi:hypothetical protein